MMRNLTTAVVMLILATASAGATSVSVSRVCVDAAESLSEALDDIAREFTRRGAVTEEAASRLLPPRESARRARDLAGRLHQRIQRYASSFVVDEDFKVILNYVSLIYFAAYSFK